MQVSVGKSWAEYFGGVRIKYNTDSSWNLAAQYTYGIEQTQIAQAYLGYRQNIWTTPINFRVGYRYVSQDYKDGAFKWDTVQQGPVVGIGLAFKVNLMVNERINRHMIHSLRSWLFK
jgi:lipopolysaccharide assembly outer membrane protein LptD (OstA)